MYDLVALLLDLQACGAKVVDDFGMDEVGLSALNRLENISTLGRKDKGVVTTRPINVASVQCPRDGCRYGIVECLEPNDHLTHRVLYRGFFHWF
jgi:hypothetical protein